MNSFLHQIHMKKYIWNSHENYFCFYCLFLVNIFSWISHAVILSVHWFNQICRIMIYFSGDARSVSVTYRLFKLPPGTKGEPTQVKYKGQISGYEKEFTFTNMYLRFVFWIHKIIARSPRSCFGGGFMLYIVQLHCPAWVPASQLWCFT